MPSVLWSKIWRLYAASVYEGRFHLDNFPFVGIFRPSSLYHWIFRWILWHLLVGVGARFSLPFTLAVSMSMVTTIIAITMFVPFILVVFPSTSVPTHPRTSVVTVTAITRAITVAAVILARALPKLPWSVVNTAHFTALPSESFVVHDIFSPGNSSPRTWSCARVMSSSQSQNKRFWRNGS